MSSKWIHNILREHLGMKKLCAKWVPCFLPLKQKQGRKDFSTDNSRLLNRSPEKFLHQFITTDET